ncbi:MAG: tyrosine-type recombinase/integrase [Aureliella sp.]
MASLELRNGTYRIVFRYGGQKFARSLKTSLQSEANLALARLEDNLRRAENGSLPIKPGADIPTVMLTSGAFSQRVQVDKTPLLGELLDRYIASIPQAAIEKSTWRMLHIHVRHLKRHLGVRMQPGKMSLNHLQAYVNARGNEPGLRGKTVGPTTIKKELSTLNAVWNWAIESKILVNPLPKKSRLRFSKQDEKPPFKTWSEIERIVERGALSELEAQDYWDCVYLDQPQIEEFLKDVAAKRLPSFLYPMLATAAYTGARRSELLRSQIEDIDLESGQMVIREKKRTRGQRSTRAVPISPKLNDILVKWMDTRPAGRYTFTIDGTQLSFDQGSCYFQTAVSKTKWDVLRGWHVLRHSFISSCASHGVDQRMIDDWVGHQTDAMRRRYRHLFPNKQRQALAEVFA